MSKGYTSGKQVGCDRLNVTPMKKSKSIATEIPVKMQITADAFEFLKIVISIDWTRNILASFNFSNVEKWDETDECCQEVFL